MPEQLENPLTEETPDPGWRDADRSRGLDLLVAYLDHFDAWKPVQNTRRSLYRLLRSRPGDRILDAGCGTGIDVAALAPRVLPGGLVQGMDLSERMVAIAEERYGNMPGVAFVPGSVTSIPVPDANFDASFSMRTIQYLDEPLNGIRELMRVTRPGGRVAVIEGGMFAMHLPSPELAERILGDQWGVRRGGFGTELFGLLRRAGLKRVRVVPVVTVENVADAVFLDSTRKAAEDAVENGRVTREEADGWVAEVEVQSSSGDFFNAECFFIAIGTVPRRA